MSQTLSQRRALAARAQARPPRDGGPHRPNAPPDTAGPRGQSTVSRGRSRPDDADRRFRPDSAAAGQVLLALVRTGARVVRIEPGRVLLRREHQVCEIDRAGRVRWRRP